MSSYIIRNLDTSSYDLKKDVQFLNELRKQPEEYDEFGQGYWKNISLMNSTGNVDDSQYKNTDTCLPTAHLNHCAVLKALIEDNFAADNLKMVRARNLVDGMVIPHKDFVELDSEYHYFRVFLPLEENRDSYHSDEAGVFQMRPGEVWFLDAAIDHAAVNFSNKSRMFLCLDYIFSGEFRDVDVFARNARALDVNRNYLIQRSPLGEDEKNQVVVSAAAMLTKVTFKDILFALSKYHFSYDIPVSECYDWLIRAAERTKDNVIIEKAKRLKTYLVEKRCLGERFVINDWGHA